MIIFSDVHETWKFFLYYTEANRHGSMTGPRAPLQKQKFLLTCVLSLHILPFAYVPQILSGLYNLGKNATGAD